MLRDRLRRSYVPLGASSPAAAVSVIRSIQQGTITIAAASLSNTATITAVTTANTILIYDGVTSTTASQIGSGRHTARISLTDATTVTATRENVTDAVTVKFTAIEFLSGVNSITQGTIVMSAIQTTNTATISAVGANSFVLYLGASTAVTGLNYSSSQGGLQLTNSTTVTAFCVIAAALTVGYMVVDLDATIINSVQPIAKTDATSATSYTSTITSVGTGSTMVVQNGTVGVAGSGTSAVAITATLTDATTVTFTRVGTGAGSRTSYVTVVEFRPAILISLQRGTIAIAAATSATATISAVTTAKSFANWCNFRATSANADAVLPTLELTNTTTVTAALNTSGTSTAAYEVVEFL